MFAIADIERVRIPDTAESCIHEVEKIHLVMRKLSSMLQSHKLYDAFRTLEMSVVPILAHMEFYGIGFEAKFIRKHINEIKCRLKVHRQLQNQISRCLFVFYFMLSFSC